MTDVGIMCGDRVICRLGGEVWDVSEIYVIGSGPVTLTRIDENGVRVTRQAPQHQLIKIGKAPA